MLVNGSDQDSITGNDRGLAYGDGVFETIRLHNSKPLLLESHLKRLDLGTQRLQISLDLDRLEQVMASLEWPDGEFHEGFMLDTSDYVVEGVMRNYLLEKIPEAKLAENCSLDRLLDVEEIFFCNSIFGIWPVLKIKTDKEIFSIDVKTNTTGFTHRAKDIFAYLLESAD
jgi:branched-subunit amino acid aminotransferase/4-amino-4-deoxychorismate lyase